MSDDDLTPQDEAELDAIADMRSALAAGDDEAVNESADALSRLELIGRKKKK